MISIPNTATPLSTSRETIRSVPDTGDTNVLVEFMLCLEFGSDGKDSYSTNMKDCFI